MKTIYLVRHAKAEKQEVGTADLERVISPKGKEDASGMAMRLRLTGEVPELIISSPANRAVETAHIFAGEFGYLLQKIVLEPALYGSSEKEVAGVLKNLSSINSVLLVGHNPLLEDLASYLSKDFDDSLETCGIVCIEYKEEEWNQITKGRGCIRFVDSPKRSKLEKILKNQVLEQITEKLNEKISAELQTIDPEAAEAIEKTVKKSTSKVVKNFVKQLPFEKIAPLIQGTTSRPKPAEKVHVKKVKPVRIKKESNELAGPESVESVPNNPNIDNGLSPDNIS